MREPVAAIVLILVVSAISFGAGYLSGKVTCRASLPRPVAMVGWSI